MKIKRALILSILGLFLVSFLGLFLISFSWMPSFFIRIRGDDPDLVYSAWYKAEKSWDNANYLRAIGENVKALWMTIDFESRILISKPFYRRSRILEKQERLKEAIDTCMTGARIIGIYDLEGVAAYHCSEMEMKYHKSLPENNLVTPTVEP